MWRDINHSINNLDEAGPALCSEKNCGADRS
jgi:hypothetical protein